MVLTAISGLVFIAYGLKGRFSPNQTRQIEQNLTIEMREVLQADEMRLHGYFDQNSDTFGAVEIADSLTRYVENNGQGAEAFIEKSLKDESRIVRRAAIEAAGAFVNEIWHQKIIDYLNSEDPELRMAAIRSLGKRAGEENYLVLSKHLFHIKNMNVKDIETEWILTQITILRTATTDELKYKAKEELIRYKGYQDPNQRQKVLIQLFQLLPGDEGLRVEAELALHDTSSPEALKEIARQYLNHQW